jgi:hypothetical protein
LFNPFLAKLWINKCQEHTVCQPDYSSKDFKFPFRVIDVQSGRLVEGTPGVRYVALSYVWGGVKQVMLNKTTRPYLQQEGSITPDGLTPPEGEFLHIGQQLQGERRVVPRTICDAIRLCQTMGELYLWTDSLCIMQDDEYQDINGVWTNADKMAQIPNMSVIYGASVLTIVAAYGKDSNAGLPGVYASNTRRSQVVGTIGDQIWLSVQNNPMDAFFRSEWLTRAWTFQEFILSKRRLIFLPEQVMFHCHRLSWCEDRFTELLDTPEDIREATSWSTSAKLRPMQFPVRSNWSNEVFFPAIFIDQYYVEWLRDFLHRRLTVASDILFAFDGALSASHRYLGDFHYGLPVDYFCETLTWCSRSGRGALAQRRQGFPSWSWAGWVWSVADSREFHVNYRGKDQQYWRRVGIWGTRRSGNSDLGLWQITHPDVERWQDLAFFPSSAFQLDDSWINDRLQHSLPIIRSLSTSLHCLLIKSLTAFAFVRAEHLVKESYSRLDVFARPGCKPEDQAGTVWLPETWQYKAEAGLRLQAIIIASSFYGRSTEFPDQTDEHDPTISCYVVEEVGQGIYERRATWEERYSTMQKFTWKPITAVLQ